MEWLAAQTRLLRLRLAALPERSERNNATDHSPPPLGLSSPPAQRHFIIKPLKLGPGSSLPTKILSAATDHTAADARSDDAADLHAADLHTGMRAEESADESAGIEPVAEQAVAAELKELIYPSALPPAPVASAASSMSMSGTGGGGGGAKAGAEPSRARRPRPKSPFGNAPSNLGSPHPSPPASPLGRRSLRGGDSPPESPGRRHPGEAPFVAHTPTPVERLTSLEGLSLMARAPRKRVAHAAVGHSCVRLLRILSRGSSPDPTLSPIVSAACRLLQVVEDNEMNRVIVQARSAPAFLLHASFLLASFPLLAISCARE